ncbi:hypothetical protein AAG906_003760 [Vitis piasezkii]
MASLRVPSISELTMNHYGKLQLKRPAGGFTWKDLPVALLCLDIIKCDSVETLLEETFLQTNTCFLRWLIINFFYFSRCLQRVGLPTTLKTLQIYNSTNLDFLLPELFKCHLPFLEQFWIYGGTCESLLLSFSLGPFPKLTHLTISNLKGLGKLSIDISEGDPTSFSFLKIKQCSDLISKCLNLKLLAHTLSSLQRLTLKHCPELLFQREGLPSKLCALEIWDCDKLTPLVDLGLQMLISLTHFTISGGWAELESFPKDCLLPSILTALEIEDVSNLKSLDSKGLQKLTSLTILSILNCPELHSFGEEGLQHLTYLEELQVSGCPVLLSLTGSYLLLRWIDVFIAQRKSMGSVFARISGHDANSSAVLSTFLSFLNMKNCLGLMDPPQSWFLWANALRTCGRISLELLMIISSMRQDSLSALPRTTSDCNSKRHVSFRHTTTKTNNIKEISDIPLKGIQINLLFLVHALWAEVARKINDMTDSDKDANIA